MIKLTVLSDAPDDIKSIGNKLSEATNSVFVQAVGSKITLFRKRKKDSKIRL